ncbi:MAG TPA: hypothetical protein VFJ43_14150 [Bacteroidia bacterium]|nr:hypothetical protein [Bacteroidia bacterium]
MKPIFILLASLFFISVHAQDSTARHGRLKITYTRGNNNHRDSIIPAGRNEIYLNIAPAFTVLLGASPNYELNLSCFYKRTLKNPRLALRMGFLFKPEVFLNNGFDFNNDDWYFDVTDTSRIVNRFQANRKNKFQLNAGMEWRSKGNKRWSTFAGLDLIGGIYKQSYLLYDENEILDSTGHWRFDLNTAAGGIDLLDYKQNISWYVGLSPKAGLRYAFNSHWMMSVQTGFEAYYLNTKYYKRDSFGTSIQSNNANYFNFNINSILDEFSVVYRFGKSGKKNQ